MRRFGFLILALAALSMFFAPGEREQTSTAVAPAEEKNRAGAAPASGGASDRIDTASEPAKPPAADAAPTPAPPIQAAMETGAEQKDAAGDAAHHPVPGPADNERIRSAHLPASAEAGRINRGVETLTDIVAATQRELARIGCYEGKIDGKWGRMSRAAVNGFREHTKANVGSEPDQELLAALRSAPAQACEMSCSETGGQCAVASTKTGDEAPVTDRDVAYLPPWMREEKRTGTETDAEPATSPETKPASAGRTHPKRAKNEERRTVRKYSNAGERPQSPAQRPPAEGWPRSAP